MDFSLVFDSAEASATVCNEVTLFFRINPAYDSLTSANFSKMYSMHSLSTLIYKEDSFVYSRGMVGYKFEYTGEVVGQWVKFLFMPSLMRLPETAQVPLYPLYFPITPSANSVALKYRNEEVCAQKEAVNKALDSVEYASYGVLALSALPSKIVGLELFGVLQLTHLSLGSVNQLNPIMASLTKLSPSQGFKVQLD